MGGDNSTVKVFGWIPNSGEKGSCCPQGIVIMLRESVQRQKEKKSSSSHSTPEMECSVAKRQPVGTKGDFAFAETVIFLSRLCLSD